MTDHLVYLGLGSNLGNRQNNLERAIRRIRKRVGKVVRISTFITTEPWGFKSPNAFLNGVISCQTALSPREVLQVTQEIEREMGRTQKSLPVSQQPTANSQQPIAKYADRTIDIDILLYDNLIVDEPDLKIPHPLMQERDFVMIPLNEIRDETT